MRSAPRARRGAGKAVRARHRAASSPSLTSSNDSDLGRLRALCARLDVELHALPLAQRLEAASLDFGEVREQILAAVFGRDEPEPFSFVEPLYGAICHFL